MVSGVGLGLKLPPRRVDWAAVRLLRKQMREIPKEYRRR